MTIDFTEKPLKEIYGSHSFNDAEIRERLPKDVYRQLKLVQEGKSELDSQMAEILANAMKDWAIEKGATHFTHWFTPLTGLTAEKHDSFISFTQDGNVLLEFSGKELIKGEPDASSFPSGGLRATFEARGYTAWDVNSPAFIQDHTLYIPTAFISFKGEALDKKVPLLRSMEALNKQALRILKIFGTKACRVDATLGPEQEYFLVDKGLANSRLDILLTGRTVFGLPPAKGQEMADHYFGSMKERIIAFMTEFNYELWRLGISARTQHNEVAPNQFEVAPIFDIANVAADNNHLLMNTLEKVAQRHGLMALLHAKPFSGVNGSGKHNNWSLRTDGGLNLLDPGDNPHENAQFLVFLSAIIRAVDTYAALLRTSAANSGNDHRLGADEAPPAIISIYLGDILTEIIENLSDGKPVVSRSGETLEIGVTRLPKLPKDLSDRNRTSPFAFTGNKFEFRMVASSASIATPTTILNTAVADILKEFADELEKAEDKQHAIDELIKRNYRDHRKIIFNGNGYSKEWVEEAGKRGLPNIQSTVEALPQYTQPQSLELFKRHGVMNKEELESRTHVFLAKYSQQINIEANVMIEMAAKDILPAGIRFAGELAGTIQKIGAIADPPTTKTMEKTLKEVSETIKGLQEKTIGLKDALKEAKALGMGEEAVLKTARGYRERVIPAMARLRALGDHLETLVPRDTWPLPTYTDMLFRL